MKKILLLATIATIGLSACVENEVNLPEPEPQAISFGTYVGNAQTRGVVTDLATLQVATTGFGVNASLNNTTAPDYMYNQLVKYDATASNWSYSPIKYWPTNSTDVVNFYAWGPYGCAGVTMTTPATAATVANQIEFTLQTDPTKMVDFVAANAIGKTATSAGGKVDFNFKHELSRLRFSAVTDEALGTGSHVFITGVTLKGNSSDGDIYTKATYTFSSTDNTAGTWTYNAADLNAVDINLSSVLAIVTPEAATYGGYVTPSIDVTSADAANPTQLFTVGATEADNQYLFFIPAANGTTANKNTLSISYDIVTVDGNLVNGYVKTSTTKEVALPENILKQGVAYNICLKIDVNQIAIGTVKVEDWNPENTGNVNI